jgi:hypothetical protein
LLTLFLVVFCCGVLHLVNYFVVSLLG